MRTSNPEVALFVGLLVLALLVYTLVGIRIWAAVRLLGP